jgi:pimeloyl-ACP methyl ester carboxylesterase
MVEHRRGNLSCHSAAQSQGTMRYKQRTAVVAATAALGLASVGLLALFNRSFSQQAERDHRPVGDFLDVQGVRLHYLVSGSGPCVVFFHGNGSLIGDFACSGVLAGAAAQSRVVAFDRPGFGHSSRPRNRPWTPEQQAEIIAEALDRLGIERAVLVGHSWGTLVALALALRHPEKVSGLVLASGYYFPTPRPDIALMSLGAIPWIGTVLCHTLLPALARIVWPFAVRDIFNPNEVPAKFDAFPKELALRPSQVRASAQEAAMIVPSTMGLTDECRRLNVPVALICGAGDQMVDPQHSARLQKIVKGSTLSTLLFHGHMVHHTATARVLAAIDDVKRRSNML